MASLETCQMRRCRSWAPHTQVGQRQAASPSSRTNFRLPGIVHGAEAGKFDGLLRAAAQLVYGLNDVRDDVAGTLDQHGVADAQVLGTNKIFVVEGYGGDGTMLARGTGSSLATGVMEPTLPTWYSTFNIWWWPVWPGI